MLESKDQWQQQQQQYNQSTINTRKGDKSKWQSTTETTTAMTSAAVPFS